MIGQALAVAAAFGTVLATAPQSQAAPRRQSPAAAPSILTPSEKSFPTHTIWVLKEFNGKPAPAGEELTLSIDETFRASGYSGCNSWSATIYPVKGQRLAMGPVALTRNTCAAPRVALERAFLTALHAGPSWDLTGADLVVKGPRGALRFQRSI